MKNERKTENIIRNHFNQFLNNIIIEEQKSDNPIIDKALRTASKNEGGGAEAIQNLLSHTNTIAISLSLLNARLN